jgi:hypothetical protein
MSTQNINISPKNITGPCDLKCAYNFVYPDTNLTAQNDGIMISLTADNYNNSPVTYNSQKYNVSKISIVCPSIHTFDASNADAELIIEHTPVVSGPVLNVCIPIISSTNTNESTYFISEIIQNVAINAPVEGETTTLNITDFSLQKIIPNKPFYSYTDQTYDWIVFGVLLAIPVDSDTLATLGQIIQPFSMETYSDSLFLNKLGPNNVKNNDGIYISCKPTGSSTEETSVEQNKNTPSYNLSSITSSPVLKTIVQIIAGCIIFILIFLVFNFTYIFITTGELKMPSFSKKPEIKS